MVIIRKYAHSTYSSFSGNYQIILDITFFCLFTYRNTRCLKLVLMPYSNQMFGKSSGDTPDFVFFFYERVQHNMRGPHEDDQTLLSVYCVHTTH